MRFERIQSFRCFPLFSHLSLSFTLLHITSKRNIFFSPNAQCSSKVYTFSSLWMVKSAERYGSLLDSVNKRRKRLACNEGFVRKQNVKSCGCGPNIRLFSNQTPKRVSVLTQAQTSTNDQSTICTYKTHKTILDLNLLRTTYTGRIRLVENACIKTTCCIAI